MNNDLKDFYSKIILSLGTVSQLDKSIEELSELIKAICKFKSGMDAQIEGGSLRENIIEEIADVENCLGVLKIIILATEEEINEEKYFKLVRLMNKLNGIKD